MANESFINRALRLSLDVEVNCADRGINFWNIEDEDKVCLDQFFESGPVDNQNP